MDVGQDVQLYYDDWYLFAVQEGKENSYGLCKLREQEFDGGDNDAQGITISFVGFDISKLLNCIINPVIDSKVALSLEIDDVVRNFEKNGERMPYDTNLRNYFKNASSKAPYLIAETYVKKIANTAKDGYIEAPESCKEIFQRYLELKEEVSSLEFALTTQEYQAIILKQLNEISRVPVALIENNEKAGNNIYLNDKIYIKNSNKLTIYEKYAILMSHTANVTFNSFAAEVVFHADALEHFWAQVNEYYNSALRADISLGEEYESGFWDQYYDLNDELVQQQIKYHGEY